MRIKEKEKKERATKGKKRFSVWTQIMPYTSCSSGSSSSSKDRHTRDDDVYDNGLKVKGKRKEVVVGKARYPRFSLLHLLLLFLFHSDESGIS